MEAVLILLAERSIPVLAVVTAAYSIPVKHKGIIRHLCRHLQQGLGINEACAELGLTTDYLETRCRRTDRVALHQAHAIYVEGLQHEIVNRARLGRPCGRLKQVIEDLPPLNVPGDDKDEARASREWRRRNFADGDGVRVDEDNPISFFDLRCLLQNSDDGEDAEDEPEDKPTEDPPRKPRKRLPPEPEPDKPAAEASPAPRRSPQTSARRTWRRLFTGRAQLLEADGTVVCTAMPGDSNYPHESEFVNWS